MTDDDRRIPETSAALVISEAGEFKLVWPEDLDNVTEEQYSLMMIGAQVGGLTPDA